MTRRAMVLGAIVLAVLVCTASAGFSADPVNGIYEGYPIVKVRLDAQEVAFDVPAILMNGRTLVPVRFVTERIGAKVSWDEPTYTATITSKGVLGTGVPTRGSGEGVFDGLTEGEFAEAVAYGREQQRLDFDKVFSGYISWDPKHDVRGLLCTEYSWAAMGAYEDARRHGQVPTTKTVSPLAKGWMVAGIGFGDLPAESLPQFRFYVRQGAKIVEADTHTLPNDVKGTGEFETVWLLWYTDGMDLSLPVEVIVAKPDGSSYNLKWDLLHLK